MKKQTTLITIFVVIFFALSIGAVFANVQEGKIPAGYMKGMKLKIDKKDSRDAEKRKPADSDFYILKNNGWTETRVKRVYVMRSGFGVLWYTKKRDLCFPVSEGLKDDPNAPVTQERVNQLAERVERSNQDLSSETNKKIEDSKRYSSNTYATKKEIMDLKNQVARLKKKRKGGGPVKPKFTLPVTPVDAYKQPKFRNTSTPVLNRKILNFYLKSTGSEITVLKKKMKFFISGEELVVGRLVFQWYIIEFPENWEVIIDKDGNITHDAKTLQLLYPFGGGLEPAPREGYVHKLYKKDPEFVRTKNIIKLMRSKEYKRGLLPENRLFWVMGNRYKGLWTLKAKLLKEDTPVLYKNVSGKRVYVLMVKCGNPIFEFGDGVIEEAESFYAKSSDVKDIDSRLLTVESVLDIDKKTRKSKVIAKIKKDQKGIKEGLIEEQKKSDVIFVWLAVLTILIAGILYFVIRRRLTPTGDDNATQEPPGKDEGPEILLNGSKTPTKRPKTPPKTPEEIVVTIPSPIEELNEKLPKETPKGSGPSIKPPPEESKTPIKKPETIPEGDEIEDKSDDTSTEPIPVGPSQEQPPPEEPETPAAEKQTEPTPKEPFGEEVVMEQDETEVTPGDEKEVVLEEDPAKTEKRKEYERKNGGKKKKHGKGKNRR